MNKKIPNPVIKGRYILVQKFKVQICNKTLNKLHCKKNYCLHMLSINCNFIVSKTVTDKKIFKIFDYK